MHRNDVKFELNLYIDCKVAKKIGIVEDEGLIALDLSNMLLKLGYVTAFISDSAESALERVNECTPDLILMDIGLKGETNGLQLAKKIIEDYSIPIVFLTAFEDEETVIKVNQVSRHGYISKPFIEEDLNTVIVNALS